MIIVMTLDTFRPWSLTCTSVSFIYWINFRQYNNYVYLRCKLYRKSQWMEMEWNLSRCFFIRRDNLSLNLHDFPPNWKNSILKIDVFHRFFIGVAFVVVFHYFLLYYITNTYTKNVIFVGGIWMANKNNVGIKIRANNDVLRWLTKKIWLMFLYLGIYSMLTNVKPCCGGLWYREMKMLF